MIKSLFGLLLIIVTVQGCKQLTGDDIVNTAAIHFAGVFITENIHSVNAFRIKGKPEVKNVTDSTYLISGMLEGFSPMNYPVSIKHFNETLVYSGSNPNKRESWKCIEIYIDKKKMK